MQPKSEIFSVKEVIYRTINVKSLILENNRKTEFTPGQYCFVMMDKKLKRPLSYCGVSGENKIELTFKKTGYFTGRLFELKKNDKLEIQGPYGGPLTFDESYKNIILIAGGVGIAPLMSILRTVKKKNIKIKVSLFYSNKTKEDILYKDELDSYNKFNIIYTITKETPNDWKGELGRVTLEMIKKHSDIKDAVFYICGPREMNENLVNQLMSDGIERKNIRTENWV
ncbi:FAD-dependent oxidoreductase [Candidatus Pacearchaeota archaeon]|nr:FAD-dependent oxidoreductase [Candidatus Pacearchaeota archaeon]